MQCRAAETDAIHDVSGCCQLRCDVRRTGQLSFRRMLAIIVGAMVNFEMVVDDIDGRSSSGGSSSSSSPPGRGRL